MIYQGRDLDVVSLWSEFIDMPSNIQHPLPMYLDKAVCPNPEHDTHKKHFQVNTAKPVVHCFARCGISGSYERAIAMILGIEEKEARRLILKHTRAAVGKNLVSAFSGQGTRKSVASDDPIAKDERELRGGAFTYLPKEARAYLDARGIDEASRGKWQIGWTDEEERLVIPAYDDRGRFAFLIKRKLTGGGSFKYLYSTGAIKSSVLFGACYLDRELVSSQGLVLVEGSFKVMRLHQLGLKNTAGTLGSGLSRKQVRLIDKIDPPRVYLFFDKDVAGVTNIADAKEKLRRVPLYVCRFPKHRSDPDEMTGKEVRHAIERALPIHQFYARARNARQLTKEVLA